MIQRRAVVGIGSAAKVGVMCAVAASALVACGFQAPDVTTTEHNSIQAHDFQVGPVRVRDTFVTSLQTSVNATTSYVVVTLVNDSNAADTLTGITTPLGPVTLTGSDVFGGSLTVPPDGVPVAIDQPLLSPSLPNAAIQTTSTPAAGTFVPLQFTFANAGTSPVEQVPVVPATETTAPSSPVPQVKATPPTVAGDETND